MDRSAAKSMPADALLFHDGFGDRLIVRDPRGRPLHGTLLLRAELSVVPSFGFALNERMTELEQFGHQSFVPIRQLVRMPGPVPRLSLVSDHVVGTRLSDVLARCERDGKPLSTRAVLFLLEEILTAVSALHRRTGGVAHGALAPERILIGEDRVRITDYVLGSAIEQLRFSPERYWSELRVAMPSAAGGSRVDRGVDVAQIGMIAVALFAGRRLRDAEHIGALKEVLRGLTQDVESQRRSLSPSVRGWLTKALHMDSRRTYVNAIEAEQGLNEAMAEAGLSASPAGLDIPDLRPRRVVAALAVMTASSRPVADSAPPPPPVSDVRAYVAPKKVALRTQDVWVSHDVHPETMYQGGSTTVDAGPKPRSRITGRMRSLLQLGLLGGMIAGAFTAAQFIPAPSMISNVGTLLLETRPAGAHVLVDGQPLGVTPLEVKLDSGRHEVELRGAGRSRVFSVWVPKAQRVSQHVELQSGRIRIK